MKRLNKFLADCGISSRRKCDLLIQSGKVAVNGQLILSLGSQIDETKDIITVEGKRVSAPDRFHYILLNKPKGYVTTVSDELKRKTVIDLLPKNVRLFPVGRLDKDTTGVLLLTTDGELAYLLTHPKFDIEKVYRVQISQSIQRDQLRKLEAGIMLDDGLTRSCQIKIISKDRKRLEMVLKEGRKREIKRMLSALGYDVIDLERIRFAFLNVGRLKRGEWRNLSLAEINKLKKIAISGK